MIQRDFQLIQSKLRPPSIRHTLVLRPRLQERLNEGLRGPLTLVTAPAGFGKTTLVASSLKSCGMPAVWLSLDPADNQPGQFILYLAAALHCAGQPIGPEIEPFLAEVRQASGEAVLTHLLNDLALDRSEVLLVLDDYQFIKSPEVHACLEFLVEHQPPNLHLLILSRSDPPLPLARLRARAQLVELRASDLRFTQSEAFQFLNEVMALNLSGEEAEALEKRTEGWAAGLQMAALSMRGQNDPQQFIRAFAGTDRFIMDFMLEEVLAHENEEVRSFLLQTSVLSRLCGPLCDAVMKSTDSQAMIEELEKQNLFMIPLDNERHWYRYHHLFADLLQARLNHEYPGQAAALKRKAAVWCDRQGLAKAAVSYALQADDHSLAADFIDQYYPVYLSKGEIETVWSWLTALPDEEIRQNVALGVGYCWVLWLRGQIEKIDDYLSDLQAAFPVWSRDKDPQIVHEIQAHITILSSIVARHADDFETAVTLAEQALHFAVDPSPEQASAQLQSLIYMGLGSAYDGMGELEKCVEAYAQSIRVSQRCGNASGIGITIRLTTGLRLLGRLREAEAVCREGLDYLKAQGMDRFPAAGVVHIACCEVLLEMNQLEAAQEHLAQGVELGKWSGRLDAVRNSGQSLARISLAQHDFAGAHAAIQAASRALNQPKSTLAKAELCALEARIFTYEDDIRKAKIALAEASRLAGKDQGLTAEQVRLAQMRVCAADCAPAESLPALTTAIGRVLQKGLRGAAIELLILRSRVFHEQGKAERSEADVEEALRLAEPEGYVRVFLDEGAEMKALLTNWCSHSEKRPLRPYALHILGNFTEEGRSGTKPANAPQEFGLIEALSQREMEVLQIMAQGRTNKEIADQLIVAPGTIKAHTASIFRKLNVSNRTEAVTRARQLGILL